MYKSFCFHCCWIFLDSCLVFVVVVVLEVLCFTFVLFWGVLSLLVCSEAGSHSVAQAAGSSWFADPEYLLCSPGWS